MVRFFDAEEQPSREGSYHTSFVGQVTSEFRLLSHEEPRSEGYDEFFDPPLESKYECQICLLGLRDPVQTSCGHRFCRVCILRSIRDAGPTCPVDNERLTESQLYPDNFAKREMILYHDVFCRMKKQHGCPWKGPLGKLEEHLNECPFVDINCPNKCGKKCQRKDLLQHLYEDFAHAVNKVKEFLYINCPNKCGKKYERKDLPQHLKKDCPLRIVPCTCCTKYVQWNTLEEHLNECPFVVNCPNKCGKKCQRKDLPQHLCEDIPHAMNVQSWDRLKEHLLNECPFVDINCPNECGKKCQRKDLSQHLYEDFCLAMKEHLNNECPFVDINCPNMCGKKCQRKDFPQHLEKDCPLRKVPCTCCTKDVQWNTLEGHLKECLFEDINCPFECGKHLQRKDLPQHFENNCAHICIRSGKYCTKNVHWNGLKMLTNFGVLTPCGRNKDHTVCMKCPVFYDFSTFMKSKEKDKPKDSMTIEMEKPWPDDKRDPKNQQKLTVDEKHGKPIVSSHAFPSVNPTPSSSFSTKANSAATQRTTFSADFVGFVPQSVEALSTSNTLVDALGKSIGPPVTITAAISAECQSPPEVQRSTKATEKPEFHINTGDPLGDGMQGDEPRVARHTRRNIQQNSTIFLKPRAAPSASASEGIRGMAEEHSKEFRRRFTSQSGIKAKRDMPAPRNKTSSRSQSSQHWLWTALAVVTAVTVSLTADMETFQGNQLVWRHFNEIKVSLANVTEASRFSSFDSNNEPVTLRHCRVIYQQVGAGKWKDVLRNLSIAEVAIENVDDENRKVAEKFYQGLLEWMRSRGTQRATTKKLCEALHLAGCSEALEKLLREDSLANETEAFSFSSFDGDNEPVTETHCQFIYQQVGAGKWKDVLRNLSIEEVTIENVDAENRKVAEKLYQGLLEWMRSRGTQRATTKKLCEALRLAGCSEASEKLLREGVTSVDAPAPIPESTVDLGTCM